MNRNEKSKITRETNIADIIFKHPKTVEVMMDYGLHCIGCALSPFDTIESGAKIHGMNNGEIEEMVEKINEVIEFGE